MRLRLRHRIVRRYAAPVARLSELLRLTPASFEGHIVTDWHIDVDRDARLRPARDGYGNEIAMLYVDGPADAVTLHITGEVLTDDRAGQVIGAPDPLPPLLFTQSTRLTAATEPIQEFAAATAPEETLLGRAHALAEAIEDGIAIGEAEGFETAAQVLEAKRGDAAGLAHLLAAAARAAGYPARVVSGYRFAEPEDDGASHLWAELLVEGYGWIGFDPVHARCPDDRYIRVAVGLDAREAAPIAGSLTPLPSAEPGDETPQ